MNGAPAIDPAIKQWATPRQSEYIDAVIEHGSNVATLRAAYGLAPDDIYRRILGRWRNLSTERVEADV